MRPLRIVLLEDSPLDAELVTEQLRQGGLDCAVRRAQTRDEFGAALEESCPDLILADYFLPSFDGLTALNMARDRYPDVPFLFVSGSIGEELAVEALRSGARDFVLKSRLERLAPAVRRAVQEAQEQTRRRQGEEALLQREERFRRQADELAEDVRRKDDFLAMLSHELRKPLAPITNALYLLRLAPPPDETSREAHAVIERQVRHLGRLVDDLLDVFRLGHKTLELACERLDLTRLVRQVAEDQRRLLEDAGLELAVEAAGGPVWVRGDAARLSQVVRNLLRNAAQFTGRGGRVTVAVAEDRPNERALVAVRDTGAGVAPEVLPRLFEAFSQAEQGLDRVPGGLGLGLALVRGLVALHGGEAGAQSGGPGRGSEFSFWLPRVEPPRPATVPAGAVAGGPLRILIVEDNPDTAKTLRLLLSRKGHEVAVAMTGRQGVAEARCCRPDVVLCDLGLPELDGFGVARALRGDPATAACHLIAISGYGRDEDRRKSREAGFELHLTKPVDPDDLHRVLAALPRR